MGGMQLGHSTSAHLPTSGLDQQQYHSCACPLYSPPLFPFLPLTSSPPLPFLLLFSPFFLLLLPLLIHCPISANYIYIGGWTITCGHTHKPLSLTQQLSITYQ